MRCDLQKMLREDRERAFKNSVQIQKMIKEGKSPFTVSGVRLELTEKTDSLHIILLHSLRRKLEKQVDIVGRTMYVCGVRQAWV